MTAPRRTRARGFAPWNPRLATLSLVGDVPAVLAGYSAHVPLTILADAIEARRDPIAADAVLAVEARDRAALVALVEGGND